MTPSEGSASSVGDGSTVDGVDRVTGRVTGHVTATDRDDLSYALAESIDPGVGTVDVDRDTGRWSFTPRADSRLAAFGGGTKLVEFRVVASRGWFTRTVAVCAPIDPAEAAVTDTIGVNGGLIYAMAVAGDRLYVLNGSGVLGDMGFVNVIDTQTNALLGSIEAGSTPFDLAVNGATLYVSNVNDGTVTVVDPVAGTVSDVIDVGADPLGLAVSGDRLYVVKGAGTVSVIDLDTSTVVAQIPTADEPFGVIAEGGRLRVTNYGGRTVSVIDLVTHRVVDASGEDARAAGGHTYVAAVVGGRVYVANSTTDSLTVVDGAASAVVDLHPATSAVESIPVGAAPVDVVVSGDRLYVGNLTHGTVMVLDTTTNEVVETIKSGIHPGLMTATPDGRTVYVADVMGGTVRVITNVREGARAASPSGPVSTVTTR